MKNRSLNLIIISCLFIIITVSSMVLFNNYFNLPVYAKIGTAPYFDDFAPFYSDFPIHLRWALEGGSYSLLGPYLHFVNALWSSSFAYALAMSLLICLTIAASYYMQKYIIDYLGSKYNSYRLWYLSISSIFLCSIWIPFIYPFLYNNTTFVTQPWHNPTYIMMRPLAVVSLMLSFKMLSEYKKDLPLWKYAIYSFVLFITNFAKPSFIVIYAPFVFVYCLIDLVHTKGKSFVPALKLGLSIVISLLPLVFQTIVLFDPNAAYKNEIAMQFSLGRFGGKIMLVLSMLSGLIFPTYIFLFLKKSGMGKDKLKKLNYTWILFGIAFFERLFLYERGPRGDSGNFAWGLIFFAYILYIISMAYWEYGYSSGYIKSKKVYLSGYAIYGLNIICGVIYFILLQTGKFYRIF